jgi:hypothetical protein
MTAKSLARTSLILGALVAAVLAVRAPAAGKGVQGSPAAAATEPEHWAFRPPARPAVPHVRNPGRLRTPIDAFVLARLEDKGLSFAPDADRITLLRRAYLDLWGLPPAPEDVDAFLADDQPGAWERLLDRLLASPHFGERWGRHWLDVAGYNDTVGFDIDANLLIIAEGKWRYRDWVIAAFNRDLPYDQFVRDQLAGDERVDWRRAREFTPPIRDALIATGFLRNAQDESHEPESNIPLIYYGVLHNTVDLVGNSLLGLTLQCARCHDHKFDPISQKEYYQLMAFLTPAYNPKSWKPVYPWKPDIKDRGLPDVSPAELAQIERHNQDIDRQTAELKKQLADLRRPYEERLRLAKLQTLPEPIRADTQAALDTPPAKRNEIQKYLAGKLEKILQVSPEEIAAALTPPDRAASARLNERLAALERCRKSFGKIQALYDVGPPPPTFLLRRGNHETPGKEVQPGFPKGLTDPGRSVPVPAKAPDGTSGRRTALAQWLTQPGSRASALLARVMVNRLWQHLFGQGLVPTPENFGKSGAPPTHPELLEWLGDEFARSGWRIKPMLRLMMTSTVYRQASRRGSGPEQVDPANRLLWKMRLRRLEAEVIRDSVLAVSGRLNPSMGGPPIRLKTLGDGMVVIDDKAHPEPEVRSRRSVYLLARRAYNLSLLAVFDQPLVAVNCPRRDAAAVPLQALTMRNDVFVAEQAKHFAARVARSAGDSREQVVRTAFRLALARPPTPAEMTIGTQLLERQAALFRQAKVPSDEAGRRAIEQLCHTLLNTSEFLYAE